MGISEAAAIDAAVTTEHFDVLIVGAGISGVGGAWHLSREFPDKRFVVLESQESFGGTWHTHKYPGIRSDSDLYTFGYRFKPWTGKPIATAESILAYMGEVIAENDLARHIRYRHRIQSARWSSEDARWTIDAVRTDTGQPLRFTAGFLWMCQGYYRHDAGYTPQWPGMADFQGTVVHPQQWPQDLPLAGKRVVVIGSGATAATLIPAMAPACGHVTMLQRSPTYFICGRNANDLADTLRDLEIQEDWIHEIVRRKILKDSETFARRSFEEPEKVRKELLDGVRAQLGDDELVEKHFTPKYLPWRQRVAFVPDGDLFKAIREGRASVVTDEIERFVPQGILLKSGATLEADIVVTATGFNLSTLGDIAFEVDGKPLDFPSTVTYRGAMFTGVPNMLWIFGYFRSSWTLRADIVADFLVRLLRHMDARGAQVVTPQLREQDRTMTIKPWFDTDNFNPGYVLRGMHLMPKQGDRAPWQHTQNFYYDREDLPKADLEDGTLDYR